MTLRFITDPSQSTSSGWRERQANAAARDAAQRDAYNDPERAAVMRWRAELMAAHSEADAAARARAEYDQPVYPTAAMISNGALHRTRLAVFEAVMQAIGSTGTARDALSLDSIKAAQAMLPGATLVWPVDHIQEAAEPAGDAPRGRGRPPKASSSIVVEAE